MVSHALQAVILSALQRTLLDGEPIALVADPDLLANAADASFPFFQQCVGVWLRALLTAETETDEESDSTEPSTVKRRRAATAALRSILSLRGRAAQALTPLLHTAAQQPRLQEQVRTRLRNLLDFVRP